VIAVTILPVMQLAAQAADVEQPRRVTVAEIEAIMRREQTKGYDLKATSNAVRLLAQVILDLARAAEAQDPNGAPLQIGHEEYFQAYISTVQVAEADAPRFARIAREHNEDQIVEYRRARVIRATPDPVPAVAVTVCGGWPVPGPDKYSFDDASNSPHIRSIHNRVNSYRLLDLDGVIVHDEIDGVSGRATSGILGALFKLLGDAHAIESRMAFAGDGTQVARATAKKGPIRKTQTVTVAGNGKAEPDVPRGRPDLSALASRLERPIKISYVPFVCDPGRSLTTRAP
jgi:hypothetical protein